MRRYEGFAKQVLEHLGQRELCTVLDALEDDELVKLLAGSNAQNDQERYIRNVVTTELLNRLSGKQALLMETLEPEEAFDELSFAAARALRADISCIDEVCGSEFCLHGRNNLPQGFREISRCAQVSMPMCKQVADTGAPLRVADIPEDPAWSDTPAYLKFGIRAYAGAPGRAHDGSISAVAWVACYRPRAFTDAEMLLLGKLARRVAQTLERRQAVVEHVAPHR